MALHSRLKGKILRITFYFQPFGNAEMSKKVPLSQHVIIYFHGKIRPFLPPKLGNNRYIKRKVFLRYSG